MRQESEGRARRHVRKKGTIFSFGDLVLPFVGLMAIGLLVISGRLFFVDSFQVSQGVASPLKDLDTALENVDIERLAPAPDQRPEPAPAPTNEQAAPPPQPEIQLATTVTPLSPPSKDSPQPSSSPSQPSKPKTVTAKSTSNATVRTAKNTKQASNTSTKPGVWRVQVGAYGSKQAAQEIVSKLAKSGYTATVFPGPKYHKVWVQAGSSRQAAESAMARLKRLGYPGSYIVPPR